MYIDRRHLSRDVEFNPTRIGLYVYDVRVHSSVVVKCEIDGSLYVLVAYWVRDLYLPLGFEEVERFYVDFKDGEYRFDMNLGKYWIVCDSLMLFEVDKWNEYCPPHAVDF